MTDLPARSTDPTTARDAAVMVDRKLSARHRAMLDVYVHHERGRHLSLSLALEVAPPGLTDDEAADRAVHARIVGRHEQARRLTRTLREHDLLVPVIDPDTGAQVTRENVSGRRALVWQQAPRPGAQVMRAPERPPSADS